MRVRFGVMALPRATDSWRTLNARWQRIEDLGFDSMWYGDHMYDPRDPRTPFFAGWTTLCGMAAATDYIRIGALVSNMIMRHPAVLAKEAATLDHLSGGRLELGLGAGVSPADHEAVGSEPWSPEERIVRFSEFVEIVDQALRGRAVSFHGQYYAAESPTLHPIPIQRPRPPLTIAAHSEGSLKVAAVYADVWNSFGGSIDPADEMYELTRTRAQLLDRFCEERGRDPFEIFRSLTIYPKIVDAFASVERFSEVVKRATDLGMEELVFYWPPDEDGERVLEQVAREVIPNFQD